MQMDAYLHRRYYPCEGQHGSMGESCITNLNLYDSEQQPGNKGDGSVNFLFHFFFDCWKATDRSMGGKKNDFQAGIKAGLIRWIGNIE